MEGITFVMVLKSFMSLYEYILLPNLCDGTEVLQVTLRVYIVTYNTSLTLSPFVEVRKCVVMYMCAMGIDYSSLYDFSIGM
jgi:hypothetical protein